MNMGSIILGTAIAVWIVVCYIWPSYIIYRVTKASSEKTFGNVFLKGDGLVLTVLIVVLHLLMGLAAGVGNAIVTVFGGMYGSIMILLLYVVYAGCIYEASKGGWYFRLFFLILAIIVLPIHVYSVAGLLLAGL